VPLLRHYVIISPMNALVEQLAKNNQDLKVAEIEGVLYLVKKENTKDISKIVHLTGLPSSTVSALVKTIPQIKDLKNLDFTAYNWSLFSISDPELEEFITCVRKEFKLPFEANKREYDQFFALPQTSLQKAVILDKKGLISNKHSVALIGDDDLVSIVLAKKYPELLKITVLELDDNLVLKIKQISEKYKLNIEVLKYDARDKIPPQHFGKYDSVLIDPPYTYTGIKLFIDRSLQLLKGHTDFSGKYIFLNYGNSFKSPEKTLAIQQVIGEYALLIEDKINNFNNYIGAESIGSVSSLYILKTTPQTKIKEFKVKNIYTYEIIENQNFPYVEQYSIKILKVEKQMFYKNALDHLIRQFAKSHSLKIKDFMFTKFDEKGGETFTYVLQNSNLIAHTWPEFGSIHIDLITCSKVKNSNLIAETLSKLLKTDYIEVKRVE